MSAIDFIRDPKTKALVNSNENAYRAHRASRDAQNNILNRLNNIEQLFLKYQPVLDKMLKEQNV